MGAAVPASPSVPASERDDLNLMYVCCMALCVEDVPSVRSVQAADRNGSAFWANNIFWKGHFQILKFNLNVTYFFFQRN